jgi:hypothetical protein
VNYISIMEAKFYGLTRLDLRRAAYQLARRNNIQHPFGKGGQGAVTSRAWLDLFLKCHKNYSSANQQEHLARSSGFNKESDGLFLQHSRRRVTASLTSAESGTLKTVNVFK